jgi:hypothetical protein
VASCFYHQRDSMSVMLHVALLSWANCRICGMDPVALMKAVRLKIDKA